MNATCCAFSIRGEAITVEPLNKGHLGTLAVVFCLEVVPYSEVHVKTVLLCTNIASVFDNEV